MKNQFKKGYTPWNKGLTKADHPTLQRMSEIQTGRPGYWTGKKRPDAKWQHLEKYWRGEDNIFSKIKFEGVNHAKWKGDSVGYQALHTWVRRQKGIPTTCEHCGYYSKKPRKVQWANKSREYKRDPEDWISLCAKCHCKYDRKL